VAGELRGSAEPSEPAAHAALGGLYTDGDLVYTASSMPIRDQETFVAPGPAAVRFLANRGANGIDGVVSSALGAGIATGLPTWVLIGELALQHDAGGLLAARRAGVPLEILCINNGGGGIFDFLPVAEHADPAAYEAHIATPSEDVDLAALWPGLREVRTDRRQNVRLHRELVERVAASL
jgi:2-succinyl-5-enolpyruvyl-6-hydroxy-3-cyclohexene-1-carboxylate synthase